MKNMETVAKDLKSAIKKLEKLVRKTKVRTGTCMQIALYVAPTMSITVP